MVAGPPAAGLMHFHGYTWRGATASRSAMVPEFTREWLQRTPSATWDDAAEAAEWLATQYARIQHDIKHTKPADWPTAEEQAKHAQQDLSCGQEVMWEEYLGGTTALLIVMACPDRWGKVGCPTGRD